MRKKASCQAAQCRPVKKEFEDANYGARSDGSPGVGQTYLESETGSAIGQIPAPGREGK